jgi:DNA polymerase-3 subunit delta
MAPLIIINGGDEFLNDRTAKSVTKEALAAVQGAEEMDLDAQSASASDFVEAVSPSLLSSSSVVRLDHLESASDDLIEALEHYAKDAHRELTHAASSSALSHVVIAQKTAGQKGSGIVTTLKRAGANVVTVPDLKKERDQRNFVMQEFRRRDRAIAPDAADLLIAVLGSHTGELVAMCDQLCDDSDENPLTRSTVSSEMSGRPEVSGFTVSDRAFEGNLPAAVQALRQALVSGVEPVMLVGALSSRLRQLALMGAVAARTITPDEVHIQPWIARRLRYQLRGWTSDGMLRCFEALASADEQAKTTSGDPQFALEKAVELIASKGNMSAVAQRGVA